MKYAVRSVNRQFTEAYYDSWVDLMRDWATEIHAGTHRVWLELP